MESYTGNIGTVPSGNCYKIFIKLGNYLVRISNIGKKCSYKWIYKLIQESLYI